MKRKFIPLCAAGLTLAPAALFLLACGDGQETPARPSPYEPSEPKYALANVELAFGYMNADLLDSCLDRGFKFYFDLNDVNEEANGYVIPEYWSKADILQAAGNMFARVYATSLSNNWRTIGSPAPSENTYFVSGVALRIVVMVDAINGYAVNDGTCDYEFAQDVEGAWRLTRWKDRSRECGCIDPFTLGRLLAGYYL